MNNKKEFSGAAKEELLDVLTLAAKDRRLLEAALRDFLTPAEYREIATRWQIVKRLAAGEGHRTIASDLKVGISTVARGSRMLSSSTGGFNQLLAKLGKALHRE
jgi:Trp operon repressor